MDFDGNLGELTARVRLHPDEARNLRVLELVRVMRAKWTAEPDPVEACDEFPGTAWLVRRKVEMMLPRPPRDERSEEAPNVPVVDAGFLDEAVGALRRLHAEAGAYRFRPLADPAPKHRSVVGANPERLAMAWPRLRPRPAPPVVRIKAELDPITDRVERWRMLLRTGRVRFPRPQEPRREVVGMFVALMGLWAGGEVVVRQTEPYSPLEVESRAPGGVSE